MRKYPNGFPKVILALVGLVADETLPDAVLRELLRIGGANEALADDMNPAGIADRLGQAFAADGALACLPEALNDQWQMVVPREDRPGVLAALVAAWLALPPERREATLAYVRARLDAAEPIEPHAVLELLATDP